MDYQIPALENSYSEHFPCNLIFFGDLILVAAEPSSGWRYHGLLLQS